jgi:hypothetical protein
MPPRRRDPGLPWVALAFAASAVACAWTLIPRTVTAGKPVPLGNAGSTPHDIRRVAGAWIWIERPDKKPARLMRTTAGESPTAVSEAEAIAAYDTDGKVLVWSQRTGKTWSVLRTPENGSEPQLLWSGAGEPGGLKIDNDTVVWTHRNDPKVPGADIFPALSGSVSVQACPLAGGAVRQVTELPEPGPAQVLGRDGDQYWVASMRQPAPGSTGLWKVPAQGGTAVRFHSAQGMHQPLQVADGTVWTTEPSRESAPPIASLVLVGFGKDGKRNPVADWLPASGRVYDAGNGVLFGDRENPSTLWRARGPELLPEALPVPDGTEALAAGEGFFMVRKWTGSGLELAEVRIP